MVTAVSREQDLDLAGSRGGPEPIGIDVTRSHVMSWCHGTGRGLCPGPGNVLRSSGVSAPELCGLGPLRGYDQVVDPHGLIDGRTPPDVGPDDELGELEVGPGSRPKQHRSEEHTSELQSRLVTSYAVFCLKKKKKNNIINILYSKYIK